MLWLTVTLVPFNFKVPAAGSVVMMTACKVLGVLSLASAKPKSAAANVLLPSSDIVIVESVPVGASFTDVTLIVNVLALALVSTPPFAVPPLSWTLKPILSMLAYA